MKTTLRLKPLIDKVVSFLLELKSPSGSEAGGVLTGWPPTELCADTMSAGARAPWFGANPVLLDSIAVINRFLMYDYVYCCRLTVIGIIHIIHSFPFFSALSSQKR